MNETDNQINPGVTSSPWAKNQTQGLAFAGFCLLKDHLDGRDFVGGQRCGQCSTHATGQREVHVRADPDHSCQCLQPEQINALMMLGIIVIWEDGGPTAGSVQLPDSPPAGV